MTFVFIFSVFSPHPLPNPVNKSNFIELDSSRKQTSHRISYLSKDICEISLITNISKQTIWNKM